MRIIDFCAACVRDLVEYVDIIVKILCDFIFAWESNAVVLIPFSYFNRSIRIWNLGKTSLGRKHGKVVSNERLLFCA